MYASGWKEMRIARHSTEATFPRADSHSFPWVVIQPRQPCVPCVQCGCLASLASLIHTVACLRFCALP